MADVEKEPTKTFVATWLENALASEPKGKVIAAIDGCVAGDLLDEARLLRELQTISQTSAKEIKS